MKSEVDLIKKGLKLLPSGLWDFVKKIYVFFFFYGRLFAVIAAFSIGIAELLKILGIPIGICKIVSKIVLIVGQIIPAASYVGIISEDPYTEGSTDICFSGWLILSLWIWNL